MKQLNLTNKIYAALLILLIIATVAKLLRYKSWERYYYGATFSAPRSYPIYIRNGYFILSDGDIAPVGSSEVNNHGTDWGYGDFQSPNTKERLPEKLVLEYASYRDQSFYADTLTLPAMVIKQAFENMVESGISTDIYNSLPVKRLDFVIGVANKGNIVVWLRGEDTETTLLKHKINPHEPIGDETYHNGRLPKKEYLKQVFYIDSADQAAYDKGLDASANFIDTPSLFKSRLSNGGQ